MKKTKIKLISIGHLPINFQEKRILRWKSSIFEVSNDIENFALRCNSDEPDWTFSDDLVEKELPEKIDADFMIAIVNVPIENNWYSRRLAAIRIRLRFFGQVAI
jgi:hypothetical protein